MLKRASTTKYVRSINMRGTNQYITKRHKTTVWKKVRGYIALFVFLGILAYILTAPIYAADTKQMTAAVSSERIEKEAGESAKMRELEAKVDRFDKFMQMQVEINDLEKKWRQTQEVINLGI